MKCLKEIYSNILHCAIIMLLLCSCNNDEDYDIYGNTTNKVFLTNSTVVRNFQILHTYLGSKGAPISVDIPVSCSQRASEDIYVKLSVDNSLVEKYNEQHTTSYEIVPDEVILFENEELKIPANTRESEISAKMSIQESEFTKLRADAYLIPIVIEYVSNDTPISEERKVLYSIITTSVDLNNIDFDATVESANVSFIEDRSAWTGCLEPVPSTVKGNYTCLLDGNEETGFWNANPYNFSNSTSDPIALIMDLKKEYEVAGVYLNGIKKDVKIFVSVNGDDWTEMGIAKNNISTILFYLPFKAQYVKFEFPATLGWTGRWSCTGTMHEFKCFIKNE